MAWHDLGMAAVVERGSWHGLAWLVGGVGRGWYGSMHVAGVAVPVVLGRFLILTFKINYKLSVNI